MSLKQELNEFYHSLSDYDYKLLRTIKDVLIRPAKVIEAPNGQYTSPIRFVLTLFSSVFVVLYLVDPSWVDSYSTIEFWRVPLEVQEYERISASINRNYSALINGTIWIPIYFLSLRLLFWGRKSWYFFYKMAMYQSTVIFVLYTVGYFLIYSVEQFDVLVGTTLIILFLIQFLQINLQKWYVSIAKGIVSLYLSFWVLFSVSVVYIALIQSLIDPNHRVFEVQSSDNKLNSIIEVKDYPEYQVDDFIMTDSTSGYFLGYETVGYIRNDVVEWSQFLGYEYYSNILLADDRLLVFSTNSEDSELMITIINHGEDSTNIVEISESGALLNSKIISHTDSTITIFLRQDEAYLATLYYENDDWRYVRQPFGEINKSLYDLIPLSNGSFAASYVFKPQDHISRMEVGILEDNFMPVWKESIYDKFSPYNSHRYVQVEVDEITDELYTHYTLANDSLMVSYIHSFELSNGEVKFASDIQIPINILNLNLTELDENYFYLAGGGHKTYAKRFWQPSYYYITTLAAVDRENGELAGFKFFGETDFNSISNAVGLFQTKDNLFFFSDDYDGWKYVIFEDDPYVFRSLNKSVLFE